MDVNEGKSYSPKQDDPALGGGRTRSGADFRKSPAQRRQEQLKAESNPSGFARRSRSSRKGTATGSSRGRAAPRTFCAAVHKAARVSSERANRASRSLKNILATTQKRLAATASEPKAKMGYALRSKGAAPDNGSVQGRRRRLEAAELAAISRGLSVPNKIITHQLSQRPPDAKVVHGDADLLFFKVEWCGYGIKPTLEPALRFAVDARAMAKNYLLAEIRRKKSKEAERHRRHQACVSALAIILQTKPGKGAARANPDLFAPRGVIWSSRLGLFSWS